jgi:hypothetical protein
VSKTEDKAGTPNEEDVVARLRLKGNKLEIRSKEKL